MPSRRDFIKGVVGLAAAGTFAAGYWDVVNRMVSPTFRSVLPDPAYGTEARFTYSTCLGCNVRCGIRAKVVDLDGVPVVTRIEGNPYHTYNRVVMPKKQMGRLDPLPYATAVASSLGYVGTLCARGADGIHYLYDPHRVVTPLKRAGPRGSGKWKAISWDQLIDEVVNGGNVEETGEDLPGLLDLFAYGRLKEAGFEDPNALLTAMKDEVDALVADAPGLSYADIQDRIEEFQEEWNATLEPTGLSLADILIDPDRPDLGPKANQVAFVRGRGQGHADYFYQRWTYALGSVNWLRHTSSCQLGYYAGNRIWAGYTDINPDVRGAKVLIMAGAQIGRLHPGATGQGLIIERAADGDLKVYYVNPVSPRGECNGNFEWVPIRPGTDSALAMALVRWMVESSAYNATFLQAPNAAASAALGEPVYTNATWLVVTEEGHAREGTFLKASDVGIGTSSQYVVYEGALRANDEVDAAELFFTGTVNLAGQNVEVKTTLTILRDEALSRTMGEWSEICGVPVETMERMAQDFADAAPTAATYVHRGIGMHPHGEYSVWAYRALDLMVGNYHHKGGLMARASHTNYNGYLYNTGTSGFGQPVRWGPPIDRHGKSYEGTLEYWIRMKRDGEAYPALRPWYPLTPEESYTELFAGTATAYPYPMRALFLYYANPVISANYGVKFIEVLKDPSKLPLFVAITTSINETFLYADYVVPDTTYMETGTLGMQYLYASSGAVSLAEGWRVPVVLPLTQRIGEDPNGYPRFASMWEFLIDVGKALEMPGYGDAALPGIAGTAYEGESFPLHSLWDYIMRVYANGAMDAVRRGLVPEEVPSGEVELVEDNYVISQFKDLIPNEWPHVAYVMARGGVFTSYDDAFDSNGMSRRSPARALLEFWDEKLATTRNSLTGEKFYGGPKYFEPATYAPVTTESEDRWSPGTPLRDLWPETDYPMVIVPPGSPLFTKHRSDFYYWTKQIMPRNHAILHPEDAEPLEIVTGDVVRLETPQGWLETSVLVEPTVARGSIAIPVGMGRWCDTLLRPRDYFRVGEEGVRDLVEALPDRSEIPKDSVNPVKGLPELVKRTLYTRSPPGYYGDELTVDEWRFNGISPNPVSAADPSTGNWPLLSWLGAAQVYFCTPAKITKTGRSEKLDYTHAIW